MRLSRVRFTVRRLMAVILVIGLLLGGIRAALWGLEMYRRSQGYRARAAEFAWREGEDRGLGLACDRFEKQFTVPADYAGFQAMLAETRKLSRTSYPHSVALEGLMAYRSVPAASYAAKRPAIAAAVTRVLCHQVDWRRRLIGHYRVMRAKYRHAASRPWERVPPDPSEPARGNP